MSALTQSKFWADAFERAIKTFAQSAVAMLTASGVLGLFSVNWGDILSVAGLATVVSIFTSIASSGGGDDSASLIKK